MLQIHRTTKFKQDVKRQEKRKKDLQEFIKVLDLLINGKPLPAKYKNHKLVGNYRDRWECHIEPDWLLIYFLGKDYIIFERTGSHSDLFK